MTTLIKFLFIVGDLIFLNVSIYLSIIWMDDYGQASDHVYIFVFSNLTWVYLILLSSPYKVDKAWSLSKISKTQLAFVFMHLLVVASLVFFLRRDYSFAQIGIIYVFFIPVFFAWKLLIYYLRKVFTSDVAVKNFILIGRNITSNDLRKYYLSNPELRYRFLGYLEFDIQEKLIDEIREINTLQEVHVIFCCTPEISSVALKPLIDFGLNSLIKVKVVTETVDHSKQSIQFDQLEQEIGKSILIIPLDESKNQLTKRIFDLLFSITFLMLFMSWLLPIVALLIKFDSRGPVFFVQLRSGKDNRSFKCLKFRTMQVNNESDFKQATLNDSRITKLGALLRKSSIDELPQFINVFIGNMSVVGPRPHMLKHTEQYSKLIEIFMGRHYVKPGITGLAQCMGYRGETQTVADMENRVRLDRYYIENWSFWLDIKIIFLTIISLIRGSEKAL